MLNTETQAAIEQCAALIAAMDMTISFAESATAGSLAFAFSQTSYSGWILKGGLVCYDACLKEDLLGIPKGMIEPIRQNRKKLQGKWP